MSNVIYKDFKRESERKKLLEKDYINACFTQIDYQLQKAWNVDEKEFFRLKEKINTTYQTMKIFDAIGFPE